MMESTAHDFSVYALMLDADPVVKAVLALLILSSMICWSVIVEKLIRLRGLNRAIGVLEKAARGKPGFEAPPHSLAAAILEAGDEEQAETWGDGDTLRDRGERAMRRALKIELEHLEFGLPMLATIASAAPFIGLFGTVWGIVNSFSAIATQRDTSLAVVAPGIAEALIATAIGLAAAIPAVIAFNQISVSLSRAHARGTMAIAALARNMQPPVLLAEEEAIEGPREPALADA